MYARSSLRRDMKNHQHQTYRCLPKTRSPSILDGGGPPMPPISMLTQEEGLECPRAAKRNAENVMLSRGSAANIDIGWCGGGCGAAWLPSPGERAFREHRYWQPACVLPTIIPRPCSTRARPPSRTSLSRPAAVRIMWGSQGAACVETLVCRRHGL